MTPADLRNMTWAEVEAWAAGARMEVHTALAALGPATVRELAAALELEHSSVAPRVTELRQAGLVECVGRAGRRGVYAAVEVQKAQNLFEEARRHAEQLLLPC